MVTPALIARERDGANTAAGPAPWATLASGRSSILHSLATSATAAGCAVGATDAAGPEAGEVKATLPLPSLPRSTVRR